MKSQTIRTFHLIASFILASCGSHNTNHSAIKQPIGHALWHRNAVVYKMNVRQFTDEGTLKAATEWLGELSNIGVGSLATDNLQYTYKDIFSKSVYEMTPIFNETIESWDYKFYARVKQQLT